MFLCKNIALQSYNFAKTTQTMTFDNPDKIFFTSDTHFGSAMALNFCKRPYDSTDEMDEELVQAWNSTVPEDGIVFHLGDFCEGKDPEEYLRRLNGRVILICGNHDSTSESASFSKVAEQMTIYVEGQRIILNHYPLLCFGGERSATWQLFGHVHSGGGNTTGYDLQRLVNLFPRQYDVGVDNNGYRPVSFNEVKSAIERQVNASEEDTARQPCPNNNVIIS